MRLPLWLRLFAGAELQFLNSSSEGRVPGVALSTCPDCTVSGRRPLPLSEILEPVVVETVVRAFGGSKLSHDDHFDRNSEAVFLQIV